MLKPPISIEEEMMIVLPERTMKIHIEEVMVISRKRKVTKGFSGVENVEVLVIIRQKPYFPEKTEE